MTVKPYCRAATKRRAAKVFTEALRGFDHGDGRDPVDIPVAYTWDPAKVYPSTLFLGLISGTVESVALNRTQPISRDTFSIDCRIDLVGFRSDGDGMTPQEVAEDAAERAFVLIDDAVRTAQGLRLTEPDLTTDETAALAGLSAVTLSPGVGPYHAVNQSGAATIAGLFPFTIECTATIQ